MDDEWYLLIEKNNKLVKSSASGYEAKNAGGKVINMECLEFHSHHLYANLERISRLINKVIYVL